MTPLPRHTRAVRRSLVVGLTFASVLTLLCVGLAQTSLAAPPQATPVSAEKQFTSTAVSQEMIRIPDGTPVYFWICETISSKTRTEAVLQSQGLMLFGLPFAPLQHGNEASLRRGMVLEAEIDGDVLVPRSEIEARQPQAADELQPAAPRHGPADITFYYPDFGRGPFLAHIWCGEIEIGTLLKGGMFTVGRNWRAVADPST
jgi:hypothetical protein